jgi:predicted small lipoprotein YifL
MKGDLMRKLASMLFIVTAFTACGKKGPLLYPDMLVPAAPSDVSLQQFGGAVKMSFVVPTKDLAGRAIAGITGLRIIKRDDPAAQLPACTSCNTDFSLFKQLNLDTLSPEFQRYGSTLVLLDSDVRIDRIYTYRMSAVTKDDQEGALSAPVSAGVVSEVLPPLLQVFSHPTEIQLEFAGLPSAVGGIAGYNVYRAVKGSAFPLVPVNREPLPGNRFTDLGQERGVTYVYGVRMVVRPPSGTRVESLMSNVAEGKLKDDE